MSQIGKAYIEIIADLKKFPADLRAKLKAAIKEGLAGVEFEGLEVKAKAAGEHAAEAAGEGFERQAKTRLRKAGEEGGRGLLAGLKRIFSRNSSEGGGFFSGLTGFFGEIGSSIKDAVSSAGQQATSAGGSAFSGLSGIFGGGGDIMGGLKIAAFTVLIPAAIGLAGALFQLSAALFALPAAAGVGAAALAPLIVGFQGFGEAVGAGLSGDTKKFNEALKGLAPSARSVVKEFVALKPVFSSVKQTIQQALFQPLIGVLAPAVRTFLNATKGGMGLVANSLGNMLSQLVLLFTYGDSLKTWQAVFQTTARIVDRFGNGLGGLFEGLLATIQVALPYVEKFFGFISDGLGSFGKWIGEVSKDGRLKAWLERAADIGQKLWTTFKEIGKFVGTILDSLGDEGTDTIRGLGDSFKTLNKYLTTDSGKEFLHNLGVLVHWAGDAIVFLIFTLNGTFIALNFVFDAVRWLVKALGWLGGAVWTAIKAVGGFFAAIWDWLKGAGKAIGDFFTKDIPNWVGGVVDWFKDLPGKIIDGLSSGSAKARSWFGDLVKGWYEDVLFNVGQIIGLILGLPQWLPQALSQLGQALSDAWTTAWNWFNDTVRAAVHGLIDFFASIPGLLADAATGLWNWAKDTWTTFSTTAEDLVRGGVNKVIDFFTGIPARIRALGPQILEAAKSIGHKIAEGLTQIGDFASDLGKKVTNALKSGINWVIDSINRGIADVDDKLPGTLPRIPKLARGAIVDSPTLALVGEAGPEAVIPLSNPKRAQELAEQSGLLRLLGRGARTVVNVVNYLDPSGVIIPTVKRVVNDTLDDQGDAVPYARAA